MRRLFVALPVAAEVVETIESALAPLRTAVDTVAWTRPSGWHVTLAFLGSVAEEAVADAAEVCGDVVTEVADEVGFESVRLRTGPAGSFGRRVVHLSVADEPAGSVVALGQSIQEALDDAGLPVDRKPVRPHLTLARARRRTELPAGLVDSIPLVGAEWTVAEAVLMESMLGQGPARYEAVASLGFSTS